MKIILRNLILLLFLFHISATPPFCTKIKLTSATVKKTIPGIQTANIVEKYILSFYKSKGSDISISKVWIGDKEKGGYLDFTVNKIDNGKVTNEKLENLKGSKTFAVAATFKYPANLGKVATINQGEKCPVEEYNGEAIVEYMVKSKTKYLIVDKIERLETERRR